MMTICSVVVVLFLLSLAGYCLVGLSYGLYQEFKPSYLEYVGIVALLPVRIMEPLLSKMVFWTRNGMFYHPENRPERFFKDGEKVFFFNIQRIAHGYGTEDGLVTRIIPEGRNEGIIEPRQEGDEACVIRVIVGGQELQVYRDNPLLMHGWEFFLLKNHPLLRAYYYVGLHDTMRNLKEVIKKAP